MNDIIKLSYLIMLNGKKPYRKIVKDIDKKEGFVLSAIWFLENMRCENKAEWLLGEKN